MTVELISFRKGRKVDDPCTVSFTVSRIDGDPEAGLIPLKLVANRSDLVALQDLAWEDSTGLGRSIAELLSDSEIQDCINPEPARRWNIQQAEVANQIMRSARWVYAISKHFSEKSDDALPTNWKELLKILESRGHQVDSPVSISYAAVQEAFYDDATKAQLRVFDDDDVSDSFSAHYLFSDGCISPSRIIKHFLKVWTTEEVIKFSPVRDLLFRIKRV